MSFSKNSGNLTTFTPGILNYAMAWQQEKSNGSAIVK